MGKTHPSVSKQRQVLDQRLAGYEKTLQALKLWQPAEIEKIKFCEAEIAKLQKELKGLRRVSRTKKQLLSGWGWTGRR